MRPLVSYDDISVPQYSEQTTAIGAQLPSPNRPPSKKRKRSNQKSNLKHKRDPQHVKHWDDPGASAEPMTYDQSGDDGAVDEDEEYEEESRELTYEEIWDDSALIDAWNAASEEYEAFHGPEKDWKKAPVHKSPLWYNVPPSPKKNVKVQSSSATTARKPDPTVGPTVTTGDGEITDSQPLNFDTFVPTHDPSLELPMPPHPSSVPGPDYTSYYLPEPPGPMPTADEAFSRALGAMYWGGYWTAVYHCQRNATKKRPVEDVIEEEQGEPSEGQEEIEDQEDADDGFLPTQR